MGDKRRSEDRKPQAVNISCPQGNQSWHLPSPPPITSGTPSLIPLDPAFPLLHSHLLTLIDPIPTHTHFSPLGPALPVFPSTIPFGPQPSPLQYNWSSWKTPPAFVTSTTNPPLGPAFLLRNAEEDLPVQGGIAVGSVES